MACSADKKRVLAVRLEDVLQPCLDLILHIVITHHRHDQEKCMRIYRLAQSLKVHDQRKQLRIAFRSSP